MLAVGGDGASGNLGSERSCILAIVARMPQHVRMHPRGCTLNALSQQKSFRYTFSSLGVQSGNAGAPACLG